MRWIRWNAPLELTEMRQVCVELAPIQAGTPKCLVSFDFLIVPISSFFSWIPSFRSESFNEKARVLGSGIFHFSNKCEMAGQAPSCQHPGRISPLAAWILVVEEWAKWIYVV